MYMLCLSFLLVAMAPAAARAWDCGGKNATKAPLQLLASHASLPAHVALLLRAARDDSDASAGDANHFLISEDGVPIESGQQWIVDDAIVVALHVMIRRSAHSNTTLAAWRPEIQTWLRRETPARTLVKLSFFTGRAQPTAWTNWTQSANVVVPSAWPTAHFDTSSSAYEAILAGLSSLESETQHWPYIYVQRVLLVWTDDMDRVARVERQAVVERLQTGREMVVLIDAGGHWPEDVFPLDLLVTESLFWSPPAWEYVRRQLHLWTQQLLLLVYCSPSREGRHTARVKDIRTGQTVETPFNAHGFGGECARDAAIEYGAQVDVPWPSCAFDGTEAGVLSSTGWWLVGMGATVITVAYLVVLGCHVARETDFTRLSTQEL